MADTKPRLSVLMPSTLTEMASISAESSVVSQRSLSINEALCTRQTGAAPSSACSRAVNVLQVPVSDAASAKSV